MSKNCSYCYYGDKCGQNRVCKYYDPIEPDAVDELIAEATEKARKEFMKAWLDYANEDEF